MRCVRRSKFFKENFHDGTVFVVEGSMYDYVRIGCKHPNECSTCIGVSFSIQSILWKNIRLVDMCKVTFIEERRTGVEVGIHLWTYVNAGSNVNCQSSQETTTSLNLGKY